MYVSEEQFTKGQYYSATIIVANYLPIQPRNYFVASIFPIRTQTLKKSHDFSFPYFLQYIPGQVNLVNKMLYR